MNITAPNNDDLKSDQQGVTVCPDKTRCMNDSTCTQSSSDAQYSCKCPTHFLGNYCEIKVSSYCTLTNESSTIAFCTNGGLCKERVPWNSTKVPSCSCTSSYKGAHCETISTLSSLMNNGMGIGKAVGLFIGCILLLGFVVIIIYIRKKRKDRKAADHHVHHHSPLELQQHESIDFHDDDDDEDLSFENGKKNSHQRKQSVDAKVHHDMNDKNRGDSQDRHHDPDRKQMEEIDIL